VKVLSPVRVLVTLMAFCCISELSHLAFAALKDKAKNPAAASHNLYAVHDI
jgi:hypothetical protein